MAATLDQLFLEQVYTFGAVDRDPRERAVTVAYDALVKLSDHGIKAAIHACDAAWFAVSEARGLAFDYQHWPDARTARAGPATVPQSQWNRRFPDARLAGSRSLGSIG